MDESKLTKKQQQVVKLIREGKTPDHIARKMRITRNAVYGHIARMKRKGISLDLPEPATQGAKQGANGHPSNGSRSAVSFDGAVGFAEDLHEVEERVKTAIDDIEQRASVRLHEIADETKALAERMEQLSAEEMRIKEDVTRAEKVKAAVA